MSRTCSTCKDYDDKPPQPPRGDLRRCLSPVASWRGLLVSPYAFKCPCWQQKDGGGE